jgi:ribosomal protein S18 acetylase RimI-like enzyme
MVCGEAQRNAGQVGGARVQIIEMDEARADDVALLFARAFQDDPILVHACPDADKPARWQPWLFRWSTWQGLRFGRLLGTAGDLDGAAALVGPGGGQFTDDDLERLRFDEAQAVLGAEFWDHCGALVNAGASPAEAALHDAVPEPHWYLDALAVKPERQGQGIGSALLLAAIAYADADMLPLVLLTCQPRNVDLYKRHGFEVVCQVDSPDATVQWWGIRRHPRS